MLRTALTPRALIQGHVFVILFDWFLSGVVALMTRSGGAQGLADGIVKYAKSRKMTMFFCFLCGCAIFFDGKLLLAPWFLLIPLSIYLHVRQLYFGKQTKQEQQRNDPHQHHSVHC